MTHNNKKKSKTPNRDVEHALSLLFAEIKKAREAQAHLAPYEMDVSNVTALLAEHPQIVRTLELIREKEQARTFATKELIGTTPQADASGGAWAGKNDEPLGVGNANLWRRWGDENELVRIAIGIRRKQIEGMRPIVVPIDPKKPYSKVTQAEIQLLFDQPNERGDSWRDLAGPTLEDILVLDRGTIIKNMTLSRKPVALYYADGATIRIYANWSGNPKEPRYLYVSPDGTKKQPLRNDECICIIDNTASWRYGLSPVQALQKTILADLDATATAARLGKLKPPPNAIYLQGATPKEIDEIASRYSQNIAGKKELFFFGSRNAAQLFPLIFSAKDNQLLEWQVYLARKVSVLFQLSPQKFGLTMDVNRATAQVQEDIDEDRGLVPLLLLLEIAANAQIVANFAPRMAMNRTNLAALNLHAIFPEVSEAARKLHARETIEMAAKALAGGPSMTINMVLDMLGHPPLPGGNTLYSFTANGAVKWLSYDEPLETMPQNAAPDEAPDDDPDEAENDDTDEEEEDTTGEEDPEDTSATKFYDARPAGHAWSPMHHIVYTKKARETKKKRSKKRSIPDEYKKARPGEVTSAKIVLEQQVQKLFDEARKRGNAALRKSDHE